MQLLLPKKKKVKYPKWLLLLFAISVTSWMVSFVGILVKLIIAIVIWQLPTATDFIGLWFGMSNGLLAFSIWIASKYG